MKSFYTVYSQKLPKEHTSLLFPLDSTQSSILICGLAGWHTEKTLKLESNVTKFASVETKQTTSTEKLYIVPKVDVVSKFIAKEMSGNDFQLTEPPSLQLQFGFDKFGKHTKGGTIFKLEVSINANVLLKVCLHYETTRDYTPTVWILIHNSFKNLLVNDIALPSFSVLQNTTPQSILFDPSPSNKNSNDFLSETDIIDFPNCLNNTDSSSSIMTDEEPAYGPLSYFIKCSEYELQSITIDQLLAMFGLDYNNVAEQVDYSEYFNLLVHQKAIRLLIYKYNTVTPDVYQAEETEDISNILELNILMDLNQLAIIHNPKLYWTVQTGTIFNLCTFYTHNSIPFEEFVQLRFNWHNVFNAKIELSDKRETLDGCFFYYHFK